MFPGTEENNLPKAGTGKSFIFQSLSVFFSVFFQTGKRLESDSDWKKGKKWLSERLASLGAQFRVPLNCSIR